MSDSAPTPDAPTSPATPTPAELQEQAAQLAEVKRALIREAKKPITLSFGSKSGRLRRNSPCPCGSGRKYKVCCMQKVNQGQYQRLTINGPVDPKTQPATRLGPSRGVVKYIRRKIAERNAAANNAYLAALDDEENPETD
jgi:hypothetical protein